MIDDRRFDRLLREALDGSGPVRAPDRLIDLALAESAVTRRRRPLLVGALDGERWPRAAGWLGLAVRPSSLRWSLLLAVVAASLALAAVAGSRLLDRTTTLPIGERFTMTASMSTVRVDAAAVTLADGRVLIAGGWNEVLTGLRDGEVANGASALATAEIFDPGIGRFTTVGPMTTPRQAATATLLDDGRVLVTGGFRSAATADGAGYIDAALTSAEVFDPRSGRFSPVGDMADSRAHHAAIRLADGSVMVFGGIGWEGGTRPEPFGGTAPLSTIEIFDPQTDGFRRVAATLASGRWYARAAALADGRVLIPGGDGVAPDVEIFDPVSETVVGIDSGGEAAVIFEAIAVRLADGRVLIAGELADRQGLRDLRPAWRLFDPTTNTLGAIVDGIAWMDLAVDLADGRVLLLGSAPPGMGLPVDPRAVLFDPGSDTTADAGPTAVVRERGQVAARTGNGQVLIAGGLLGTPYDIGSGSMGGYAFEGYDAAELYTP
jgi:hypothetical protein